MSLDIYTSYFAGHDIAPLALHHPPKQGRRFTLVGDRGGGITLANDEVYLSEGARK